ncbi:sulfatase family protein [Poriferisphaera sp. WC338]|uniref:sulfatase family protein n=1 Tax=Poriferisphaera sp. WC338 TaxID=3425129 RepID=UPI003D81696F
MFNMTKPSFVTSTCLLACSLTSISSIYAAEPLNVLLFTADDLGYEAITQKPDLAPNLNRFAQESISFERAHMNMPICMPSRSIIATGRYGHRSGMMGFFHMKKPIPTVMQTFRDATYKVGVLGKVNHSTPDEEFEWDYTKDYPDLGAGRDPEKYYQYSVEFIKQCRQSRQPFYFMVNSHDPHRPFHNPDKPLRNAAKPSKLYSPEDVVIPAFLPDLPDIRVEMSHYYNSVRRLDDTFGRVMDALKESGMAGNTLVLFVSDNGSPFPFAKANAYLPSTLTNCFVRWPGVVKPGRTDNQHFVSSVDFFPTFLDAARISNPGGMDGRSMVPLLRGETDSGRKVVFTQIDYKIGGPASPMRAIENERYRYIFNPWSGKDYTYRNNNEGLTMKAMDEAAAHDSYVAERVRVYRHRDLQEFYDLQADPGCTKNLINNTSMETNIVAMRNQLQTWMNETSDPLLLAFVMRDDHLKMKQALLDHYPAKESMMTEKQLAKMKARSAQRKARSKQKRKQRSNP